MCLSSNLPRLRLLVVMVVVYFDVTDVVEREKSTQLHLNSFHDFPPLFLNLRRQHG